MQQGNTQKHYQNNQRIHQGDGGFRLVKSISRLKPFGSTISPAKEETEGRNPQNKQQIGCSESLEKHHKRKMQTFDDVNVSQV